MKIDDLYINYYQYGKDDGIDFVFLHGWGQNMQMMMPLSNAFAHFFKVTVIDLPGFGKSDEPNKVLSVLDYVNIINKLFKKLNIKNPILLGHSFGGRIGILYASIYNVRKLILLASPYQKTTKKITLKQKILKKLKKIKFLSKYESYFKNKIGSADYKNASLIMKKILVESINTDLTNEASKIKCVTLLIWGESDLEVKIEDAYKLNKLIKNSSLIVYPNKGHFAYLQDLNKTIKILDNFLKDESR